MNATDTNSHIFANDDRPVFRIIVYCLTLAFSVLIASLQTLRGASSGFAFEFSWRTILTFVISAALLVPCFKIAFLSPSKRARIATFVLVAVIGLASLLYPLRFVQSEKLGAIFTGLTIATCVLSTIGGILFAINRFLNADQRETELKEAREAGPHD